MIHKLSTAVNSRVDIERYTSGFNRRLHVDNRQIIDCLKRHFVLAATYYETSEFKLMNSSQAGIELASRMREELGYSRNSYWWDIVHKRLDLYRIAKRELREAMCKMPQIQQVLDFLDAKEKENLTRGTTKGITMQDETRRPGDTVRAATCESEKPMDLKRHKQINELGYKLKAMIDKELGKEPLKYNEVCMLGDIMQRIIPLK